MASLSALGPEIIGHVSGYLSASEVLPLALSSRSTLFLNSEPCWAGRVRHAAWIERTLREYLRLTTWRAVARAADVFRGLCSTAVSLGIAPPTLPVRSPYAVRVAAVDRVVEEVYRFVTGCDGRDPVHWRATLHLAAFYTTTLRQISLFRRRGEACADPGRDTAAMRAEVPVLLWSALMFFSDALPNSHGFASRWARGPPNLVCRTIALFRITARPVLRCCLELLRHTHPSTRDPIRDAASLLLTRVMGAGASFAAAVPFVSSHVAAVCAAVPSAPPRVPLEAMERAVRSALKLQCAVFAGDGLWEALERTVMRASLHRAVDYSPAAPYSVDAPPGTETLASKAAATWASWQAGLATLPLDQAEACAVAAFQSLPSPDDETQLEERSMRATMLLAPSGPDSLAASADPGLAALWRDGDFIAGSSGFEPFSSSLSSHRWLVQPAFVPQAPQAGGVVSPSSPHYEPRWSKWVVHAARHIATGLFAAVSPDDLCAFAMPDEFTPCRVILHDLSLHEMSLSRACSPLAVDDDVWWRLSCPNGRPECTNGRPELGDDASLDDWGSGSQRSHLRRAMYLFASLHWLLQQQNPVVLPCIAGAVPCPVAPAARARPPLSLGKRNPAAHDGVGAALQNEEPASDLPPGDVPLVLALLRTGLLPRTAAWALSHSFPAMLSGPLSVYARLVAAGQPQHSALTALVTDRALFRWVFARGSSSDRAQVVDAELNALERLSSKPSGLTTATPSSSSFLLSQPTAAHAGFAMPLSVSDRSDLVALPTRYHDYWDVWGRLPQWHLRSSVAIDAACCVWAGVLSMLHRDAPPGVLMKLLQALTDSVSPINPLQRVGTILCALSDLLPRLKVRL
jgi:hypothetical protein